MADRPAGVLPYGYCTIVLEDSDGQETQRRYEIKSGTTATQCIELADVLQAITQLAVKDVLLTTRVTGFTPSAAETNSSVAETASVAVELADGRDYSFRMPALKSAIKSGSTVIGTNAALLDFLEYFDDGAGIANVAGDFYVSDGQEISEAFHEDGKVTGVVNK
jgi:hypothetical protein